MASFEVVQAPSPAISPKTYTPPYRTRIAPYENSLTPVRRARRASVEGLNSSTTKSTAVPWTFSSELPKTKFPDTTALQHDTAEHSDGKSFLAQAKEAEVDRHDVTLIAVDLPHTDGKLPIQHSGQHGHLGVSPFKTIYIGQRSSQKLIEIPTSLLVAKSRYFRKLFEHHPHIDHMVFDEPDPFAMVMWQSWLVSGKVKAPDSFHSLTHWFGLYIISVYFGMEELQNHAMDTIRAYYRVNDETPSTFRVEFVYKFTTAKDLMRDFVVATATMRAIAYGAIKDEMREILIRGGDISHDYAQAIIEHHHYKLDPRDTPDCRWHTHQHTQRCKPAVYYTVSTGTTYRVTSPERDGARV